MSVVIATIVVVVLCSCLFVHPFLLDALEPVAVRLRGWAVVFHTPSWCDGSLTITPPTVEEVVEEVAAVVRCLSVAVVALFLIDTVVRCLCCLTVGAEELHFDEVEVLDVACRTDGFEELTKDEVEVVIVDCCPVGVEALTLDDVADR